MVSAQCDSVARDLSTCFNQNFSTGGIAHVQMSRFVIAEATSKKTPSERNSGFSNATDQQHTVVSSRNLSEGHSKDDNSLIYSPSSDESSPLFNNLCLPSKYPKSTGDDSSSMEEELIQVFVKRGSACFQNQEQTAVPTADPLQDHHLYNKSIQTFLFAILIWLGKFMRDGIGAS